MKTTFSAVSRTAVRAFGVAVLILAPGIWAAPDLNSSIALGVAALIAGLAAAVKTVQELIPSISFANLLPQPWAAWADAFTQAALGAFVVAVLGWMAMPDFGTWKSVLIGALIGAGAAGARALEGLLTPGETPIPSKGVKKPVPAR